MALVSIHAPARGATSKHLTVDIESLGVSIHAPARGATILGQHTHSNTHGFNPRARTGRDYRQRRSARPRSRFQSTRPHGARPYSSV